MLDVHHNLECKGEAYPNAQPWIQEERKKQQEEERKAQNIGNQFNLMNQANDLMRCQTCGITMQMKDYDDHKLAHQFENADRQNQQR